MLSRGRFRLDSLSWRTVSVGEMRNDGAAGAFFRYDGEHSFGWGGVEVREESVL